MKSRVLAILVSSALGCSVAVSARAADPVRVPGTTTSLEPPSGFSPAERFPGFQNRELQSSIVVTELPAPAAALIAGMTEEGLASKGMQLLSSSKQQVGGRAAVLLHTAQNAGGTEFLKWMLLTGDETSSVMVVGTFPKSLEAKVGDAIRSALLSASWSKAGSGDSFEGLSFRVTPSSKLKVAGRFMNLLLLSESGSMTQQDPAEAYYVVGPSVSTVPIEDLQAFSETRAKQTAQVKEVQNVQGRAFELGKLRAYELLADAADAKSGLPLRLYQVVALDGDGYVIAQGFVGAARASEMLAEFRSVTESFERK